MRLKSIFTAAVVAGAFGVTVSAALAQPLMLGPMNAPMIPKIMAVPIINNVSIIQNKALNSYRELRSFWLSRAIVR